MLSTLTKAVYPSTIRTSGHPSLIRAGDPHMTEPDADAFRAALMALTRHPTWPNQAPAIQAQVTALADPHMDAHDRANKVRELLVNHPELNTAWLDITASIPLPDLERQQWPGGLSSRPPLLRWECTTDGCTIWDYGDAYGPYRYEQCPRHASGLRRVDDD
jgi:hypothetical protein